MVVPICFYLFLGFKLNFFLFMIFSFYKKMFKSLKKITDRFLYGLAISITFVKFWVINLRIRTRYYFYFCFLKFRRVACAIRFSTGQFFSFFARFPQFLRNLLSKRLWCLFSNYVNYRAKRRYFNSFKWAFARFRALRKERVNFIELFSARRLALFQYFVIKNWMAWEPDISFAYRFFLYSKVRFFFQPFWFRLKGLNHLFYGKVELSIQPKEVEFPFDLLRHTHFIQYQLNADQLSKRWREPFLKTENHMLYVRYYFPYTWRPAAGYVMNITDEMAHDVLPAGPDLFDVEAYFEYDGEPPFAYEEVSWDLGWSLPDRFRSWLNYTTFFGTKNRIAKLMMDYELYQLYVDLEEMLLYMKDRSSASFIGSTGLDEYYLSTFKPVKPEIAIPALAIPPVDPFEKFWSSIFDKSSTTSYVGFSTVQTFGFIGSQIGVALIVGFSLAALIHGEYESFIRVHAPWIHDINYSKIFFRNHIHPHYHRYFIAHHYYWPLLYEGGFWSRLLDWTYRDYVCGRFYSIAWIAGTLAMGSYAGWTPLHPGDVIPAVRGNMDKKVPRHIENSILPWVVDKYHLPSGFNNPIVYKFARQNDDLYFTNLYLPVAGLGETESWFLYLLYWPMIPLYYLVDFFSACPVLLLLILFPILFVIVKVFSFRFLPYTFEGATFYMTLSSSLGSILPYVKAEFRALELRANPLTAVQSKLDRSDNATLLMMRFQSLNLLSELQLFYDYFIHLDVRELLAFKYDYLGAGRENSFAPELRALSPYGNWVGWYSPTEEDEWMDADFEFLTDEADDEDDDSDDPGTDLDYELHYGMTSFQYAVRSPLYSLYWKARERSYYNGVLRAPICRALLPYESFVVKDFFDVLRYGTSSRLAFNVFNLLTGSQSPYALTFLPPDVLMRVFRIAAFRRLSKNFYRLQLKDDDLHDLRLFELHDVTLPAMVFPSSRTDTTDIIVVYNSLSFARRVSFAASLLSFAWYKTWMQFFFFDKIDECLHVILMHIRHHPSVFLNEPTLRDLPETMEENYVELFEAIDEDLDEVLVDTTTYPLDFIEEESEFISGFEWHNWFENPITLKLGFASPVVTYDLSFMFYRDYDGKQLLTYSLNDFYWASNTLKTWVPVVPEEEIEFVQYLLFSKTVTLTACLFNGFYAAFYDADEVDIFSVNKPIELALVDDVDPTYNLYSWDQVYNTGAWPYGLSNTALDVAITETVMKRVGSTDPDAMDWINFTSMDLKHFPHLSYEQRMYMLLDWKMRQFMNLYVEFEISNPDAADMEILDFFAFQPWLGEPESWIVFSEGYAYESLC